MRALIGPHPLARVALLSSFLAACPSQDPPDRDAGSGDLSPSLDVRDAGAVDSTDDGSELVDLRSDPLPDALGGDTTVDTRSDGDAAQVGDARPDVRSDLPDDPVVDGASDLADAADVGHADVTDASAHDLATWDGGRSPDALPDRADDLADLADDGDADLPAPTPSRITFGAVLPGETRTSIEVVLDNREPLRGLNLLVSGAPLDRFEGTLGMRTADVGWRLSESESPEGWRILSSSDVLSPLPAEVGVLLILRLSPTATPATDGLVCFEQAVLPSIDDPPRVLPVELGPCLCYAPPCT
jgi:hypothetical protein